MERKTDVKQPVLFVSHGAPTLAIADGDAHRFLKGLGRDLDPPTSILVMSAHYIEPEATLTATDTPETIHDFGNFDQALYEMRYPAPGDPALADRAVRLLNDAGVAAGTTTDRGLDHGAWIPLALMYPAADIPVIQVSLDPRQGPEYHYRLGTALSVLRDEGVLIIGSGGVTHNLGRLAWSGADQPTPDWAVAFNDWVADAIAGNRVDDLLSYRERAPHAAMNHPTEEHYFPLLFALGAADGETHRERIHHSYTYAALSMDAYRFG